MCEINYAYLKLENLQFLNKKLFYELLKENSIK